MPDYLSPAVYIQELEGPAPINGVSTSIAAFVGMAERGPVNTPILCASPSDYTRWFGGLMTPSDFADPHDAKRAHCYLPYAVAGFFNNAGQIAYVTRVLPEEATYASETLFDRGSATSAASILMRSAAVGDGLGTTAATGALIMLDPVPGAGDFRLDDGSVSEYLQVAGSPATVTDFAALDAPLQVSHSAASATALVYARNPIAPNGEALVADAAAGDFSITVESLDPLDTFASWLIELAADGVSNIRVPATVTKVGTAPNPAAPPATVTVFTIAFAQPLTATFSSAAGATTINKLHTGTPTADPLDVDASGGDLIVYATPTTALTPGDLIDIDTGAAREVRQIANLVELGLDEPTSVDWPAGTALAAFAGSGFANTVTAPANPPDTSLTLASRNDIVAGSVLLVGASPNQESVTVQTLAPPIASGLDAGVVTLTAPLAYPHVATDPVVLLSTTNTTAAAPAGAQSLSLGSRVGIEPGSILQIDAALAQEYVVVLKALGARAVSGPDPGVVVLDAPLINAYPNKAAVILTDLAEVAAGPASLTVIDAPAGSTSVLVSSVAAWAAPEILQASLPDGMHVFNQVASVTAATLKAVTVTAPVQNTHPAGSEVVGRDPLIVVQALDQGGWGERVGISIQDEDTGLVPRAPVASIVGPTQLKLTTLTGIQPGSYLELWATGGSAPVDAATPLKVSSVNLANATVTFDAPISALQSTAISLAPPGKPAYLRSREFCLVASLYRYPDPAVPSRNSQVIQQEVFHNLSMDPRHSQYFETVIGAINGTLRLSDNRPEGASWLIRTQDTATTTSALQAPRLGPEGLIDVLPNGLERPAVHKLQGGDDSMITVDDGMYVGADDPNPRNRSGIYSLLNVPQISIVAVPGQGTPEVQAALIDHCENALYRFAVLDPQYPDAAIADIQAQRQSFDTKFAAIYYPWLTIPDPLPSNLASVADFPLPPSGHVVGIYARVDDSRGVFKAPANEVVQGITGLTRTLVKGDQDVLNPSPTNVNVIRDFRQDGRGIRVWGARVITSDDNYKYVPVKRLMMFIEQSLDVGLQDIVFEPNESKLWASVERLIGNFLTTVWNSGGLQGDTPDQAFFVRCDLTTMTQDDIDNGRLIALVGVAPVKPAEFVIIQITLNMTSNAS